MKYLSFLLFTALCAFANAQTLLKQSSTAQPLEFYMTASSDHLSPCLSQAPVVTLRKVGGSFATPSGTVTEIAKGWYQVAGNATDTSTLGPLLLNATVTGTCDITDKEFSVVAFDPQAVTNLGLTALPAVASGSAGAVLTSGTGTAQVSTSSGAVTVGTNNDKTAYSLSGTQTFNTTGNLSGAVGSVTARVTANTDQLGGQAVSTSGTVTFPAATVASTNNITGGTIATVTNLTNAPTSGDLTTTMKASVQASATAATPTIASVSGTVGTCNALGTQAKTDVSVVVAPIKSKTDQLTFTVGNTVDSNTTYMNSYKVNGGSGPTDKWRH